MLFHSCRSSHPGTCPGCTTDIRKHGQTVPGTERDDTMDEVSRIEVMLEVTSRMVAGLWEGMPNQRQAKVRALARLAEAAGSILAYRLARERMD